MKNEVKNCRPISLFSLILLRSGKGPPTNVEISPKNFLTFSFNPFVKLVKNFKAIPRAGPKLLNLKQDHP